MLQKIKKTIKTNSKRICSIGYIVILLLFLLYISAPLIPMGSRYWFGRLLFVVVVLIIALIFHIHKNLRARYILTTVLIIPFFPFAGTECASFVRNLTLKSYDINICFIINKRKENIGFKGVKYAYYLELVGIDYIYEEPCRVDKKTYDDVEIGDTLLLKVSRKFPHIYSVYDWKPTNEEINKYIEAVKLSIYNDSIKQPATIINTSESKRNNSFPEKNIDYNPEQNIIPNSPIAIVNNKKMQEKYVGKGTIKKMHYMIQLRIGNYITNYFDIDDMYRRQIYESLNEGDTVIIQKPKSNSEKIQVISWKPTPEEKEKYRTQVQMIENN